jgi:hypothetical protein
MNTMIGHGQWTRRGIINPATNPRNPSSRRAATYSTKPLHPTTESAEPEDRAPRPDGAPIPILNTLTAPTEGLELHQMREAERGCQGELQSP